MFETKKVPQAEAERQERFAAAVRQELINRPRSCYIETYGCQMNVRDSEIAAGQLLSMGFTAAPSLEEADLVLFNTCCVRDHAEKRVFGNIGMLRESKEAHPDRILGVFGCMMQQEAVGKKLFKRFPYVDLVFGTGELYRLPECIAAVLSGERVLLSGDAPYSMAEGLPSARGNAFSAFVNIMYGCDNYCSYCIVPYVRGRERSRAVTDVVREARGLTESGVSELTLLGQNVNSYRGEQGEDFATLLKTLNGLDGLKRIRYMSSHPKDLTSRLIDAVAENDKVCHHIHLPVQSGSDRILMRMNRRYTSGHYLELVDALRERVPDMELTTDVIVGFPGETEEDFSDTLALIDRVGFAGAFTFKYSPRTGTAAAKMPDQVEEAVKRERLARLNALQSRKTRENNEKYLGKTAELLIEGCEKRAEPLLFGKYGNFKQVYFQGDASRVGSYCKVRAEKLNKNSLFGTEVTD